MNPEVDKNRKKQPVSLAGLLDEDRPQPHSLETERAVLAAMLREPDSCGTSAIEYLGNEDVFYSHVHREVFRTITTILADSGKVDLITVVHALNKKDVLEEVGGEIFLAELYSSIATTANFENWCGILKEHHILRGMINVCSESLRKCYEKDIEIAGLVDQIESDIYNVRNSNVKSDIVSIRESIRDVFENIQDILAKKVEVGLDSGYPDLNKLIVGLKPGEMFVLAARPSIGKTTFALNLIRNIALRGNNMRGVLFFSLEMTAEQIVRKLLCMEAEVSESSFYDGSFKEKDMPKLTRAVSFYRNANIFIDPTAGLTVPEMRAKARRLKTQHNIEMICIDYLQLMKAGMKVDGRQQEVAEISSGVKKLAKDLNVPVVVLAQLNREVEKTAGGSSRPKLSNLRESGAIEQDADIVAFLHRNRDEAKDMTREAMIAGLETELIIEKNRNGQTGIVYLSFHPHLGQFHSRSRYSDEDNPERE